MLLVGNTFSNRKFYIVGITYQQTAELILHDKQKTKEGDIIEVKIWKVEKSRDFPDGIKYSFVYVHNEKRVLGYDNERGKGHHKHFLDKEEGYE